jgi:integrase/recombinase XerD
LGHSKLETTALYARVATNTIREVMSPLDRLTPLRSKKHEIKNETKQETKAEPPT